MDNYVAQVDALPAAIAAGNELRLETHLTISIPDEVMQAYYAEMARLEISLINSRLMHVRVQRVGAYRGLGPGSCAPPLPLIGLAAADLFAGGEVSRADSRVR